MSSEFLFSIDLEDVRSNVKEGYKYKDRVEENTVVFLDWMQRRNVKCTFFVVGKIAEIYPNLIKRIIDQGHEIACHSYAHQPIINLGIENFKSDLIKNIEVLEKAGAKNIIGYRAPTFSLTQQVNWVYKILDEHGIKYSSSVLPAKSPLFGWESFGTEIKIVDNIIEMPMSVDKFGPMTNIFYNFLMYYNRKNLFKRLDKILDLGYKIVPYSEYLKKNYDKF
jgi:peptidoglycan/xylan/chitin deacetylase (PgdA/CDA1 family)